MAIYHGGLPMGLFEQPHMKEFIKALHPVFTNRMAGRFEFGQSLLDKTYQEIKGKVQSKLDSSSCLNFVTDGSTNVSHGRIENLLVTTDLGAFTLALEDLPDEKRDTTVLSNWVDKKVTEWTHGDSKRVNSLATDTANTMKSVWKDLDKRANWNHVFFIPCDSHGIQLFMKDLTELFWFREIFAAAQRIVSYFHGADKQLAILRKNQRRLYSREYALSLSVITRWGSQYRLTMSPLKSRQALKEWAIYDRLEIPADEEKTKLQKAVIASLLDHDFWQDLEELEIIIGYIHEQQLMSESGKSHIEHIASRSTPGSLDCAAQKCTPQNTTTFLIRLAM